MPVDAVLHIRGAGGGDGAHVVLVVPRREGRVDVLVHLPVEERLALGRREGGAKGDGAAKHAEVRRHACKELLAEAAQALRVADGREAARHLPVRQKRPIRIVLLQVRAAVARKCSRRTAWWVVPDALEALLVGRVGLVVGSRQCARR